MNQDRLNDMLLQTPSAMKIPVEIIEQILSDAGIDHKIEYVGDPNVWIMQAQRIFLDNGKVLLLKSGVNPEWTTPETILNQLHITKLLREAGFSKHPDIVAYSADSQKYGFLFTLSESYVGEKWITLHQGSDGSYRKELFQQLARAYSKIHEITNDWAGIWAGSPDKKLYPIHPAEFYGKAELLNGSSKYLLDNQIIDELTYHKIHSIWDSHLDFLIHRPVSLIHISPFPWSIYFNNRTVSGFAALGDFMWWDAMSDVAHLLYPPFMDITNDERDIFLASYTMPLDNRAIQLYLLLNRVCAMANCYFSPVNNDFAHQWIHNQKGFLNKLAEEFL